MRTAIKFMIMNTIIIFSILSSSACTSTGGLQPAAGSTAPTETPAPLPSKTAEPTATPTKTATPTEAPTPTQKPLELQTKIEAGFDVMSLPVITLEDITSGKLAESERQLIASGEIKVDFSEAVYPGYIYCDAQDCGTTTEFDLYNYSGEEYQIAAQDRIKRPIKTISLSRLNSHDKWIVVIGQAWANKDKSMTMLHFGVEDWGSDIMRLVMDKVAIDENKLCVICSVIDEKDRRLQISDGSPRGYDLRVQPEMLSLYKTYGNTLDQVCSGEKDNTFIGNWRDIRESLNKNEELSLGENVPKSIEKYLLIFSTRPWNILE